MFRLPSLQLLVPPMKNPATLSGCGAFILVLKKREMSNLYTHLSLPLRSCLRTNEQRLPNAPRVRMRVRTNEQRVLARRGGPPRAEANIPVTLKVSYDNALGDKRAERNH